MIAFIKPDFLVLRSEKNHYWTPTWISHFNILTNKTWVKLNLTPWHANIRLWYLRRQADKNVWITSSIMYNHTRVSHVLAAWKRGSSITTHRADTHGKTTATSQVKQALLKIHSMLHKKWARNTKITCIYKWN